MIYLSQDKRSKFYPANTASIVIALDLGSNRIITVQTAGFSCLSKTIDVSNIYHYLSVIKVDNYQSPNPIMNKSHYSMGLESF